MHGQLLTAHCSLLTAHCSLTADGLLGVRRIESLVAHPKSLLSLLVHPPNPRHPLELSVLDARPSGFSAAYEPIEARLRPEVKKEPHLEARRTKVVLALPLGGPVQ